MSLRTDGAHLPGDHLLAAYLAATGLLALATLTRTGLVLAAVHGAAVAGLWVGSRRTGRGRGAGAGCLTEGRPQAELAWRDHLVRFLRVFLPVAVTPILYTELETLNQLVHPGYLDGVVQGWETAVFGEQISVTAAEENASLWLSELLHLGYLSYYFVVPGAAVAVYRNGGARGLSRLTVTVALAFFLCYACFAVFPVAGPRYEFSPPTGPVTEGPVFQVVHAVLEAGSSKGTAFPSSHVAAAAAAVLSCRSRARGWFWLSLPAVVLLTVGTVYGRFHYGVDAAAGLLVAAAAHLAAPALERWSTPGVGPGLRPSASR